MSGISRIGASGGVSREAPSSGHEAVGRAQDQELAQPPRNEKVDQVAKLYEKQFLREMVKAMRGTVSFSEMSKPSMAENIYRDQLDSEYVESWGDNGGIGLSDLIYEQIMDKYFNNNGKGLRGQGPIQLSDRDVVRVARVKSEVPSTAAAQVPLRVELASGAADRSSQVRSPWDSTVLSQSKVGGRTAVSLLHEDGMKSTLIFNGVPSAEVVPGQRVSKGQAVGVLSPEINSFLWNLSRTSQQPDPGRETHL